MNMEDLAVKLQQVEDRSLRNEGRIKKLENERGDMQTFVTKVAVLETQLTQIGDRIGDSIKDLTEKVERLEAKPAKRWDSIVDKFLWALIAAALGYILAQLGIAG